MSGPFKMKGWSPFHQDDKIEQVKALKSTIEGHLKTIRDGLDPSKNVSTEDVLMARKKLKELKKKAKKK